MLPSPTSRHCPGPPVDTFCQPARLEPSNRMILPSGFDQSHPIGRPAPPSMPLPPVPLLPPLAPRAPADAPPLVPAAVCPVPPRAPLPALPPLAPPFAFPPTPPLPAPDAPPADPPRPLAPKCRRPRPRPRVRQNRRLLHLSRPRQRGQKQSRFRKFLQYPPASGCPVSRRAQRASPIRLPRRKQSRELRGRPSCSPSAAGAGRYQPDADYTAATPSVQWEFDLVAVPARRASARRRGQGRPSLLIAATNCVAALPLP